MSFSGSKVRAAFVCLTAAAALAACSHEPACADILLDASTASVPAAWGTLGVSFGSQTITCDKPNNGSIHLIEPSNESPEARAKVLRAELEAHGFIDDPIGADQQLPGDFAVKMRRGPDLVVFNVHRVEGDRLSRPALAIHFAVGHPAVAPSASARETASATPVGSVLPIASALPSSVSASANPATSERAPSSASAALVPKGPPSTCDGLDYCTCKGNPACQVKADGCICACDYGCPKGCVCACGGGKYLGCKAK